MGSGRWSTNVYQTSNAIGDAYTDRIIGDELNHPHTVPDQVEKVLGYRTEAEIPLKQVVAQAQAKYECFFIIPGGSLDDLDDGGNSGGSGSRRL